MTILYHYTNAAGLEGIVTKRELWATHYLFLNDPTEGRYISGLVEASAKRFAAEPAVMSDFRYMAELVSKPRLTTAGATSPRASFLFALSADDDSLSQWRGYSGTDGFALGFESTDLSGDLVEVDYDVSNQQRRVDDVVDSFADAYRRPPGARGHGPAIGLHNQLCSLSVRIKDHAYREEREWRIIAAGTPSNVAVRVAGARLVPYVPIEFPASALRKIVVGPTRDLETARYAISYLLGQSGHGYTINSYDDIVPSAVPFR